MEDDVLDGRRQTRVDEVPESVGCARALHHSTDGPQQALERRKLLERQPPKLVVPVGVLETLRLAVQRDGVLDRRLDLLGERLESSSVAEEVETVRVGVDDVVDKVDGLDNDGQSGGKVDLEDLDEQRDDA